MDGAAWSALGSGIGGAGTPTVYALAADASGALYAGGEFLIVGGKVSPYIAWCNIPECDDDGECSEGYQCVEGECEPIPDDPPAITDGPFLTDTWKLLPNSLEGAIQLATNHDVLWTFSDDFASCSEACAHVAEYQAVGDSGWKPLAVTVNVAKGRVRVTLPVESMQNATYAFRFEVTDCAAQTTPSGTYYFKVLRDAPPVITDGPFLTDTWKVLPSSPEGAIQLATNHDVLWTFSDDFASCSGVCAHVAEYQAIGDSSWKPLAVTVNVAKGRVRVTLPVESLQNATYAFRFAVIDCANQTTPSGTYYFKVLRDALPVIGDGPFLTDTWMVLPTSPEAPFSLKPIMTYYGPSVTILHPALRRARTLPSTRQSATAAGNRLPLQSMLPRGGSGLRCRLRACRTARMPSGLQ